MTSAHLVWQHHTVGRWPFRPLAPSSKDGPSWTSVGVRNRRAPSSIYPDMGLIQLIYTPNRISCRWPRWFAMPPWIRDVNSGGTVAMLFGRYYCSPIDMPASGVHTVALRILLRSVHSCRGHCHGVYTRYFVVSYRHVTLSLGTSRCYHSAFFAYYGINPSTIQPFR